MTFPPVPGADWFLRSLKLQASTGSAGVALSNAGGTMLTWNVPNDGNLHRFILFSELVVTTAQSSGGGAITASFTDPEGTARLLITYAGGLGTGFHIPGSVVGTSGLLCAPDSVVTVSQAAETTGAGTFWADLWGS